MTLTGSITTSPGNPVAFQNTCGNSDTQLVTTKTRSISPGTTYTFAASISGAYNGANPSHSAKYTTSITVPGAPTNLAASSITSGGAVITWSAPSDWGGDTTSDYKVQYANNAAFTGATTLVSINGATPTLTGLTPSTVYYVRVLAYNSAGDGPWSTPINFTTLAGSSGPPTNLTIGNIAPTTARATWAYPANDGGSPITSYEFQRSLAADFSNPVTVTGIVPTTYDMIGLSPNTLYYTRVRAVNSAGVGAWTTPAVTFTTLAGAKVRVGGVFLDKPTLVRVGGVWVAKAPQKRVGGVWVY